MVSLIYSRSDMNLQGFLTAPYSSGEGSLSLLRSCLTGPSSPSEALSSPILGLEHSVKREERNEFDSREDKVHGKTTRKG